MAGKADMCQLSVSFTYYSSGPIYEFLRYLVSLSSFLSRHCLPTGSQHLLSRLGPLSRDLSLVLPLEVLSILSHVPQLVCG